MTRWSAMFRTACSRVARVGTATGGFAAVARFEGPAAISRGQAAGIKERLADPYVVAVDIWAAMPEQTTATKEASTRPEADRTISGAVIVETTTEAAARKAKAALPGLLGPAAVLATIGVYALIALQDAPAR